MKETLLLKPVAHIENAYDEKFSIPRQPGLAKDILSKILFEKEYDKDGILKGMEGFSHLWLIWGFTGFYDQKWSPTIRPPRLGGNERIGVFASRSPHHPNPIGMSAVKIVSIEKNVITVSGADLLNGTPIYDIKPYVPYSDAITEAKEGFAKQPDLTKLDVIIPKEIEEENDPFFLKEIREVLALDPRPAYQKDPERIYGFRFSGYEVKFNVKERTLTVLSIE